MAKNKNRKKEKKNRNANNPGKSRGNPQGGYAGRAKEDYNTPGENGEDF